MEFSAVTKECHMLQQHMAFICHEQCVRPCPLQK